MKCVTCPAILLSFPDLKTQSKDSAANTDQEKFREKKIARYSIHLSS